MILLTVFWRAAGVVGRGCMALAVASSAAFAAESALSFQEVAPGIFVHQGVHALATPENEGAIANVGFIIGTRCVAVIDSGGSFAQGQALRAAISKQTAMPVCYVINTHVHPDHVYGNAAFSPDKPHFVGHRNLAASMRARHDYYVAYLARTLGSKLAPGSTLIKPDMAVESAQEIDLGGRKLLLRAWPTAHTDNDLTVFDNLTGTLWLGDLLFREHIPVIDGSLSGWLAVMKNLASIPAQQVVPGHGAVSSDWPAVMAPQERYLTQVQREVRQALRANRSILQATEEVGGSQQDQWQLFDTYHKQNVTAAFTELEWED